MSDDLKNRSHSKDSSDFKIDNLRNVENKIDLILKKLKDSDFISIFFLLMNFISPTKYFKIINMDRQQKEIRLKSILKQTREEIDVLLQILVILKKYNLLKLLNCCKHKFKNEDSFDKISPLWKVMYDVCELITSTEDVKTLKQQLSSDEKLCDSPELLFIHAYNAKLFTDRNLSELSKLFRNERPDISTMLDKYNGKVYNITYYPIRVPTLNLPCGLAIIVNHEEFWSEGTETILNKREDSKLDVDALKNLWKMFGFETRVFNKLTDKEVLALFEDLANTDHSAYDVFICCYMSHGAEGVVFASNSKPILISDLVNKIANNCPTLLKKPKLFFIQACQGSQIQKGVFLQPVQLSNGLSYNETTLKYIESNIPLNSDVLIVLSSIPGYTSFAPVGKMSWFMQSLVHKMKEYGKDFGIYDVMLKVQEEISYKRGNYKEIIHNCMQTVKLESTLRYQLKLKHLQT